MNIRPVMARDVSAVVTLVTQVLGEFGLQFGEGSETDAALRDLPESYRLHGGEFWVATDDGGDVVGTCAVFPIDRQRYELRKMYLATTARGAGIGKALLAEAIVFAKARGARDLVLDTTEQMKRAIAFYESHGFVRDDEQRRGSRCSRGYRLEL